MPFVAGDPVHVIRDQISFLRWCLHSICMQLLRVASTMSYQGSPYSGPGDEYDFEDDGYDDLEDFRDRDEPLAPVPAADDSDEGMYANKFCLRPLSGTCFLVLFPYSTTLEFY